MHGFIFALIPTLSVQWDMNSPLNMTQCTMNVLDVALKTGTCNHAIVNAGCYINPLREEGILDADRAALLLMTLSRLHKHGLYGFIPDITKESLFVHKDGCAMDAFSYTGVQFT